jgi:replicative DNA helicase
MNNIPQSAPHSIDAEEMVLSTLVQHPTESEDVIRTALRPESFFIPAYQHIFDGVIKLLDQHKPVEFASVKEALSSAGWLAEVGGERALSKLWMLPAPAESALYYATIVRDKESLRRVLNGARKIIELGHEPGTETPDVLDEVEKTLTALVTESVTAEKTLRERTDEWLDGLGQRAELLQKSGIGFGISSVDRRIPPLQPGDYALITAKTGRGKSLTAFQMALHAAKNGLGVAIFSLEMNDTQLWDRMFSHLARVSMNSFGRGTFTEGELKDLTQKISSFVELPLHIEPRRDCNIATITSRLRRLKARGKIKVCVVDYLQRVPPATIRKNGPRYLEVAEVSDRLKNLALELELVMIVPVQLNKDGDTRETASIEMDCDAHFKLLDDEDGSEGDVLLRVEKRRQGECFIEIPLHLNGEFMTLEERKPIVSQNGQRAHAKEFQRIN